jgi:hypothetical protein
LIIFGVIILTNIRYRIFIAFSFLGSLFPDIIDLSPNIINKYSNLYFPVHQNIFPWHWKVYSGSIYTSDCGYSIFYQIILIFTVLIVCWIKRTKINLLIRGNSNNKSA